MDSVYVIQECSSKASVCLNVPMASPKSAASAADAMPHVPLASTPSSNAPVVQLASNSTKSVSAASQWRLAPSEGSATSSAPVPSSALPTPTSWTPPATSAGVLLATWSTLKTKLACSTMPASDARLPSSCRGDNASWSVALVSTLTQPTESVSPVRATATSV